MGIVARGEFKAEVGQDRRSADGEPKAKLAAFHVRPGLTRLVGCVVAITTTQRDHRREAHCLAAYRSPDAESTAGK